MNKRKFYVNIAVGVILLGIFLAELIIMIDAPRAYYARNNAVDVYATVVESGTSANYDVRVSYVYNGKEYIRGYNVKPHHTIPLKGETIKIKVNPKKPSKPLPSFAEATGETTSEEGVFVVVTMLVVLFLCFGTKYRYTKRADVIDDLWVRCYVTNSELLRIVLATAWVMINFFHNRSMKWILSLSFALGGFVIIRGVVRILDINSKRTHFDAIVTKFTRIFSIEEDGINDSPTNNTYIYTEAFHYPANRRTKRFCSKICSGDKLLYIFNGLGTTYLLMRLPQEAEHNLDPCRHVLISSTIASLKHRVKCFLGFEKKKPQTEAGATALSAPVPSINKEGFVFDKVLFNHSMRVYFDEKLVREVFSTNTVTVLCVGELFYVASHYCLFDGNPVTTYVSKRACTRIIEDESYIFSLFDFIFKDFDESRHMLHLLGNDNVEFYKNFIQEKKQTKEPEVDYKFEKQIIRLLAAKKANDFVNDDD